MSSTLNRQKPYGEVWGGTGSARYHQDGKYFDDDGNEIVLGTDSSSASDTPQRVTEGGQVVGVVDHEELAQASLEAALAKRRSELLMQAMPLLESAQGEVIAELPDHDLDLLLVMQEVEGTVKKRKQVLEALEAEIATKREQDATDTAASAGQQPPGMASTPADDQLKNQLQG